MNEVATPAPSPIEIPEYIVSAILRDYAEDLMAEINGLIMAMDTKSTDGQVVMARRTALLNCKQLVKDHIVHSIKPWRFPGKERGEDK
jgi:hypothetical protein